MPAYILVDMTVSDASAYEAYKRLAQASIEAFGGRYLIRGGATAVLEGSWQPRRLVLLEFPTSERARSWYASPEYAQALAARRSCAQANMVLAEGL